ncbi:hypothetical protein [Rhodanobacter sp. C06]|uniref:hypothetical protein n=1 Tax=Rhodanobacter sp. C06 TaxID=1945854 RepID=UPI0011158407|nr:hypothetical protein [Rhodanobacter sp. C06]
MDSRVLNQVFPRAYLSIAWDKHGENEYVLVGDGLDIDIPRLQNLVEATFPVQTLWLSLSRHEALAIPREDAASVLAQRLQPRSNVCVFDEDLHIFLELHFLGVARTGVAQANHSFKRTCEKPHAA